jgi:hypothetical protein
MKRIGITASHIAKDNLAIYNLCVVLISCIFSLFIFVAAGAAIFFALVLIGYVGTEMMGVGFRKDWSFIMTVCMMSLTVVVVLFNIFAILMNIKLSRKD